jgi:tRNA nucleotidyltransferase (CCA-adding enzyme)
LSAQLGFSIDDALLRAIQEKPLSAGQVSPERVREEFFKLLCSNKASAGVRQLLDYGLGTGYLFFDCLLRTKDYDQENPYHNRTLLEHTLTVLENVPNSIELRLAALFHDVGKPDVKTIDTIAHYYGHELVSARIAEDALKELKCSTKLLTEVGILIEAHMFNPADMGKKGMKRLLAKLGGYVPLRSLLDLMRADIIGTACPERVEGLGRLYEMVDELEQEATVLTRKHLNIDGRDLIAIGFAEGREIGICLNELFEQVISDNLDNDRSVLLAYARHYLEMGGDTSAQGLVYDPD